MARWDVSGAVPHKRAIQRAVRALKQNGLVLYPTDTSYAIGCVLSSKSAFERLCQLRGVRPEKSLFSAFLPTVGAIGQYALGVDTPTYRLLKRLWPGPYTIILRPGPAIPRHLWHRRTMGFRVTTHPIVQAILNELQEPIITASVPEQQRETYTSQVEEVLDMGELGLQQTTVIDLSEGLERMRVLRIGAGPVGELAPFLSLSQAFQEA
ncbi:MAG: L-threonylcarbamoyladenylate synthase [Bacteroidia bacterium]|nr:L-threonylcarbamoyladenylate synthase [Bacteroidia bacterium]MDW8015996.1 L-threonylcarbamoyladenylate synthase [Bacteroidia bacterium]